ncbi:MAG: HAMP domain-containing protein [Bacteroidales bacterium]|nr:HAMP domain-containing protein [Bacteroidales bacterium]
MANNITSPLREFLATFKKLGDGNKDTRVTVKQNNEFGQMAREFNSMIDKLDKTTVSLDYFKTIIDNIYGALFVTDSYGYIKSCNRAAVRTAWIC